MQTALNLSSIGKRFLPFAIVACFVAFALHACTSSTDYNTPRTTSVVTNGGTGATTGATTGTMTTSAPPVITSFTPTSGASGTAVTIIGTGFRGTILVTFGGIPAASFTVVSDTQITAVVGSGGAAGNITITTTLGTATLAGFTITPPGMAGTTTPTITSFSPTSAGAGITVIINGTNFTGATAVSFGGLAATSFIVVSPTQITAVVGAGASGNVSVTTLGGTSSLPGFTFVLSPTITSFAPTSAGAGQTITINGTNFAGATFVSFGGVAATSFTVVSATQIIAVVGAGGASGSVSVTTPGGSASVGGFTFVSSPTISSFTPTSARAGQTVTITGTNFSGATLVRFGGLAATSFVVISPTQIIAVVGAEGASGNISVATPGGTGTITGFTFLP